MVRRVGPGKAVLAAMSAVALGALAGCAHSAAVDQVASVRDASVRRALADGMAEALRHADLTVSPADGTSGVSPTDAVTATVSGGQITMAILRGQDGSTVDGSISPDGKRWASSKPLKPNTSYVLTTVVRSTAGTDSRTDTKFSTIAPGQQVHAKMSPSDGGTISGASPLVFTFDKPIPDHGAVERALVVASTSNTKGSVHWRGDRELVWQPDSGWQPGSQVTATLAFFGKQVGPGLYGGGDVRGLLHVTDLGSAMPLDASGADLSPSLAPSAPDFDSLAAPGSPPAPGAANSAPGVPADSGAGQFAASPDAAGVGAAGTNPSGADTATSNTGTSNTGTSNTGTSSTGTSNTGGSNTAVPETTGSSAAGGSTGSGGGTSRGQTRSGTSSNHRSSQPSRSPVAGLPLLH